MPDGLYEVKALVGDIASPSWQQVSLNGVDAGVYDLKAGRYAWTPTKQIEDGRLAARFVLRGDDVAGLSELLFVRTDF